MKCTAESVPSGMTRALLRGLVHQAENRKGGASAPPDRDFRLELTDFNRFGVGDDTVGTVQRGSEDALLWRGYE